MSPVVRKSNAPSRRCAWRSSLQIVCVAVLVASTVSVGSAWARSHAEIAGLFATQGLGQGGPYIPADAPKVPFEVTAGLSSMDALRPDPTDALDLSAALWTSPKVAHDDTLPQLLPVTPLRITSGFGRRHDPLGRGDAFHSGIDFAGRVGTPVHASGDGVVVQARYSKDYGNVVMIDHGHGVVTLYAHNNKLEVRTGDVVLAGEEIAKMGSTGRSTGPHLHFEVRQYGQRVDPGRYLAGL